MIIHQPEIIQRDGYAILWAKIEMGKKQEHFPDYIWYRIPECYANYLSPHSDAFLVAALLAGMHFNENILVRGAVSPRLAYHLNEYQFLLNFRKPKDVRPISIQYERLAPAEVYPVGIGTAFSGGVDSLFTVWSHLPKNQPLPDYQVTHGVFISGFDILHSERGNYKQLFGHYEKQLSKLGIELIQLETNALSLIHKRLNLSHFYGPMIVSTGLALSGLFKRFYIPSSGDYHMLQHTAYSTDPLVDGLLCTDTMDIVHHDSTHRRIEKVEHMASWDVAQELLWVCLEHKFEENTWNCSWCEKCVRTMIPLYALEQLDKFKRFEKPFRGNKDGLWWARKFNLEYDYVGEVFPFVRKHKPDFLPWLYLAAFFGHIRYIIVRYMPGFMKKWLRRYGYFITRNEAPDAYEFPQVTQIIREHNMV